ncbi:hypothetical protein QOZ80_6AG0533630 [Eleusine coracana subsp. coracana]|nr:hypothetical protein QOZ80_6AG0533630 [Eleusine coracana subsp. coracana]
MAQSLPDDVLRRLPPRSLAASRRACLAWRDVVDARRLLPSLDRLLPRDKPGGIFCNLCEKRSSQFVAHPSVRNTVSGSIDYTCYNEVHCNRILLLDECDRVTVTNPATRQRAGLPPQPRSSRLREEDETGFRRSYLIFDPTVSPHYAVVSVPDSRAYWEDRLDTSPHHLLVW